MRYFCPTNLYRHQSAPHKIGRRISRSQNERFHLDFAPQRVEIFQHSKIWLLSPLGELEERQGVIFSPAEMDLSENVKVESCSVVFPNGWHTTSIILQQFSSVVFNICSDMTDSFKVRNAELQRPLLIKATPRDPELQNVTLLEDISVKKQSESGKKWR